MKTLFVVDDNATNLMVAKRELENYYNVRTMPSATGMFKLLEKITPDLILLDLEMPDINGYMAISQLKSDERTKDIPVVFLTAHNEISSELEGLRLGAIDYIYKPFVPELLRIRIQMHLKVQEQQRELRLWATLLQKIANEKSNHIINLQNVIRNVYEEQSSESKPDIERFLEAIAKRTESIKLPRGGK